MRRFVPLVFLFMSSCQWIQPLFYHRVPTCPAPVVTEHETTAEPENIVRALPLSFGEHVGGDLSQVLQRQHDQVLVDLRHQMTARPDTPPLFHGCTVSMNFESRYDAYVTRASVRYPIEGDGNAVVLLLGELPFSLEQLPYSRNDWLIHVPSRPNLSYQLVAEGDLWGHLDAVVDFYPFLANLPWYVIGFGDAADAALMIANEYRYRFHGVAINGGKMGWNVPNLDHFPVVFFEEGAVEASPFGGKRFIATLQARGNKVAYNVPGNMEAAVRLLTTLQPSPVALDVFEDYRYSKTSSWLQVLAKRSEKEPARVKVSRHEDTLVITAPNVVGARINRADGAFPGGVTRVRFNDETYTFAGSLGVMTLGEDQISLPSKADVPSGLLNFFRCEPIYVLYQDQDASEDFIQKAHSIADAVGALQFEGIPRSEVKIPVLPLSQYHTDSLPPHRIIAIGKRGPLEGLLTSREGYLPLRVSQDGVFVNGRRHEMPFYRFGGLASGLIYPPERSGNLRLALLLVADDPKGLQTLSQNYLSATALYRLSDLRLWVEHQDMYHFAGEVTFDGWWGNQDVPSLSLEVPVLSRETWNRAIHDLLAEATGGATSSKALLESSLPPPTHVTPGTLKQFVGDTHFLVVEDRARHEKSLVSVRDWEAMRPEERVSLDGILFPYSTYDVVVRDFRRDTTAFGKKLLKARS